jgi:ferredoxin
MYRCGSHIERETMQSALICYLSGTGNTWRIARAYQRALEAHEVSAELWPVEVGAPADEALAKHDLLGIGYPIHAWNAPRAMLGFLDGLPMGQGREAFCFLTAGRSAGGAFDWLRARLTRQGYHLAHEALYLTGAYYLDRETRAAAPPALEQRFLWAEREAAEAVAGLLAGQPMQHYGSDAERLLLSSAAWGAYRFGCRRLGRWLYATDACTDCGACARLCPTNNIVVEDSASAEGTRVHFGTSCTACLRCLSLCPEQAIQLTARTERMGRYLAPGYDEELRRREAEIVRDTAKETNLEESAP